jgi:thiamine pyrophosphate-dependent acetolactate synthase large subunit-like protein
VPTFEVTVAEAVTQCLLREGVGRVFGIPGSYFLPLLDAFARGGLPSVEGRHEGAAACMAAGYAQASGQVGVVYTQCGPGATNALTGFAGAYADSIPMLLLASQTERFSFGRDGHQESTGYTRGVDQVDAYRSISHLCARPATPESVAGMTRMALRHAIGRRGPSVLEIASDLLVKKIAHEDLAPEAYRSEARAVDVQGIEALCRKIRAARSVGIVVGDRVSHAGVADDLVRLCEEQGIACATVNYAKGAIAEDHPLALGVLSQSGHPSAEEYLRRADLVVSLGVRMSEATTVQYDRELFRNLVQVDDDEREIGRCLPVQLGVVGHLPSTVRALREALAGTRCERAPAPEVAALREKHHVYDEPDSRADSSPLTPPRALRILREQLPREALVVGDTGTTMVSLCRYLPVYARDGFFALYALAPMGSSLPMALGVQIARPESTVVAVMGDGAFLVHVGELSVAAQHELPVIVVVVNNGRYKSISDRQAQWYGRTYGTDVRSPDYVQLARSFGCDGYSARTSEELRAAVTRAVAARRPAVVEVPVDPAHQNPVHEALSRSLDGIFRAPESATWPLPPVGKVKA